MFTRWILAFAGSALIIGGALAQTNFEVWQKDLVQGNGILSAAIGDPTEALMNSFAVSCDPNRLSQGGLNIDISFATADDEVNLKGDTPVTLSVNRYRRTDPVLFKLSGAKFVEEKGRVSITYQLPANRMLEQIKTLYDELSEGREMTVDVAGRGLFESFTLKGSRVALRESGIWEQCIDKYPQAKVVQALERRLFTYQKEALVQHAFLLDGVKKDIVWLSVEVSPDITSSYRTLAALFGLSNTQAGAGQGFNAELVFNASGDIRRSAKARCEGWTADQARCTTSRNTETEFVLKRHADNPERLTFVLPETVGGSTDFFVYPLSQRLAAAQQGKPVELLLKRSW
jgi:hypothetical protein